MPELTGVAAGRLLIADPEAAAGCRIQIAAALLQPCADSAAVAGLDLAGKRCFRGICCRKGDLAVRDDRGDSLQCGIVTGTDGGVGDDIDGSGITVDDNILFAIDKCIRLDISHAVTGQRIDGNDAGGLNGVVRSGSSSDRSITFCNTGDLTGLINSCFCRVAAGPDDVLVGRIARSNGCSQLNSLANLNGRCCRRNRNAGDRNI